MCQKHLWSVAGLAVFLFTSSVFAAPQRPDDLKWPAGESLTVTGRVVGLDNTPLSGATVRFNVWSQIPQSESHTTTIAETKSVSDGTFKLVVDRKGLESFEPKAWRQAGVITTHPGWGANEILLNDLPIDEDLTVQLHLENIIRGRVVDESGDGIPGAQVSVIREIKVFDEETVDRWLEQLHDGGDWHRILRPLEIASVINPRSGGIKASVTTSMDGSFQIHGVPKDAFVVLGIGKSGMASQSYPVINRTFEAFQFGERRMKGPDRSYYVFGDVATLPGTACRPIRGTVTDSKTGKSIPGVRVFCRGDGLSHLTPFSPPDRIAETDSNGQYVLQGVPAADTLRVEVYPPRDRPYLFRSIFQKDLIEGDLAPLQFDVELDEGIWISGQVTDESGDGVASSLYYNPMADNEHAMNAHRFQVFNGIAPGNSVSCVAYSTDEHGFFRIPGLPGRAILGAWPIDQSRNLSRGIGYQDLLDQMGTVHEKTGWLYLDCHHDNDRPTRYGPAIMRLIDPPAGKDYTLSTNLILETGHDIILKIESLHSSATGTFVNGHETIETELIDGNEISLRKMGESEKRRIRIVNEDRSIGRVFDVSIADATDGVVSVQLKPLATIKGKLIDSDGIGLDGWRITTSYLNYAGVVTSSVSADADGNFVLDKLPTLFNYRVKISRFQDSKILAIENTIQSGETLDLGTVDIASIRGTGKTQIESVTAKNVEDE